MKRLLFAAGLVALPISGAPAGPLEDGMAAYNRGDYAPTLQIIRPLAQQGNARAQALIGVMYRKGQGVAMMQACEASNYRSCEY